MSWAEQAENWIAWARTGDDGYAFFSESFFELVPKPVGKCVSLLDFEWAPYFPVGK